MKEQSAAIKQGWLRVLLYIMAIFGLMILAQAVATLITSSLPAPQNEEDSIGKLLPFAVTYIVISAFIFALTFLFRKLIDRKNIKSLGFEWQGFQSEALLGFFTGPALLGIGTILLSILGYLTFTGANFDPTALLLEFIVMVLVAFIEELMFRGYMLHNLMQSTNKWIALLISALLFGVFHASNPDVTVFAIINVFVAGLLLGINYIYTKNLWFGIFFHFSWNFFQGPILGYDVSGLELQSVFQQTLSGPEVFTGGKFGFEASLLCPILITHCNHLFCLSL